MATSPLLEAIDREGTIEPLPGLYVRVRVLDLRNVYGRNEFLVEPLNGSGQKWVRQASITMSDNETEHA